MARQDADVWAVIGSIGAIALGVALIPLRSSVSASNLAFVFLDPPPSLSPSLADVRPGS